MRHYFSKPAASIALMVLGVGLLTTSLIIYPYKTRIADAQASCIANASYPAKPVGARTYNSKWSVTQWLQTQAYNSLKVPIGPSKWDVYGWQNDAAGTSTCYDEKWALSKVVYGGRSTAKVKDGQIISINNFFGNNSCDCVATVTPSVDATGLESNFVGTQAANFIQSGTYGVIYASSGELDKAHAFIPYEWTVTGHY